MVMWLAMATADGRERLFPVEGQRLVLGRDRRCDLRVSLPSVAERHCEIVADNGVLRVEDLGSESGFLHNGAPARKAVLAPDDELTVGTVTFAVRLGERDGRSPRAASELEPKSGEPASGGRPRGLSGGAAGS